MSDSTLKYYLSHGHLGKVQSLAALLFPRIINKIAAAEAFRLISKDKPTNIAEIEIIIEPYSERLAVVNSISDLIDELNSNSIYTAIVQGSIATGEVIEYSDFDGILIIDSSEINSIEELIALRNFIRKSEKEMLKFDVLQHHGWQIVLKKEMLDYNDAELPLVLYKNGKQIGSSGNIVLRFRLKRSVNYQQEFKKLKNSIHRKLNNESYFQSFYSYKNFISELLLLPSLFHQALYNEPVFKKDSFKLLSKDLNPVYNTFFQELSELRINWSQVEASHVKELIAGKFKIIKPLAGLFRSKVPVRYKTWLTSERKKNLLEILEVMTKKVNASKS